MAVKKDILLNWTNIPIFAALFSLPLSPFLLHATCQVTKQCSSKWNWGSQYLRANYVHSFRKSFYKLEKLAFWKGAQVFPTQVKGMKLNAHALRCSTGFKSIKSYIPHDLLSHEMDCDNLSESGMVALMNIAISALIDGLWVSF